MLGAYIWIFNVMEARRRMSSHWENVSLTDLNFLSRMDPKDSIDWYTLEPPANTIECSVRRGLVSSLLWPLLFFKTRYILQKILVKQSTLDRGYTDRISFDLLTVTHQRP